MAAPAPAPLLALLLLLLPAPLPAAGKVPMPGAPVPRPDSDPGVREAARFALDSFNRASNSAFYFRQLRLLRARSQVVEGIKYYLTMEVASTQCEKKGGTLLNHVDLEHCALAPAAEQMRQICEFEIWSRPWLNDTRLLKMDCKPS